MTHATALRFTKWARLELRSGETVRPLDDRFRLAGPKETPATLVVMCAFSTTYGSKGAPGYREFAGRQIVREVALSEIVWITGAVTGDPADALIDVRGEVERDLRGGRAS